MPLYYFIIGPDLLPANVGVELPDIEAAWQEATRTAGEVVRDLDGSFPVGSAWSMEIQDAEHKPLRTIKITTERHE